MIRYFFPYYRSHLPLFILDFSCALLMSGMELIFPLAVRKMIDDVLPAGDVALLSWGAAGLFLLYMGYAGLQYTVDYLGHVLGARMEFDMRRDLFDHVQKLSFTYFDNTKTAHIMSRIVNDLNEIAELAHHGPEDLFVVLVIMIGSFTILLNVNWQLALLLLAFIPVLLWFALVKNRQMKAVFRDMRLRIADINAQVEDSIAGVRLVKSFTNEWYEQEKFCQGNTNFRVSKEKAFRVMGGYYAGITFVSNIMNLTALAAGGYLVCQNRLSIGELVSFLLYIAIFLQPVRRITLLTEMYQKGMAGFARFTEIMKLEPDIRDKADSRECGRVRGEIRLENVSFSYNDHSAVLHDISLHINAGETVAFVGPSGAGKTTLCSLIPRFYEVDAGVIRIDGVDIRQLTQKSLRENIGIVQQDVFLFSDTLRANIAYGRLNATDEEIENAARMANAHEFIVALENGYDTDIGERGVKLSGGQKQRIAIARIFLKNPPILILDEATSALDNENERIIQLALTKLAENRTTLIIAHRLTTICNADRIVFLTDEGVAEMGTHEELLTLRGEYAALYAAQFAGMP
ncbi:MAG TPA: ABC transporter ATP-binding protein [Patescibacteria group bacterium]|nr:ABC transporter ATP-binding protein [Patescibacteria group bacterium]